jgi:hypothetical protein
MRDFRLGLRAAAGNARLLWWLLAGNLALALLAAAPLLRPLETSLSHHEASGSMARRFDMSWWVDVTTSRAEAFAGALDGVAAAAVLSALMGCFFAGGLLQAYRDTLDGLPMDRFMTSCRRWCPRFLALFALSLPIYWLVHRMVNRHLALALDDVLEGVSDERAGMLIELGRAALFLALFDLVTLIGDYARVHAVVRSDRSMLSCLSSGMRFVLGHPWRVGRFEVLALALQAAALALFLPLDALVARAAGTPAGLILALIAGQSFLLMRLFLRETARATQLAVYRGVLAASR